MTKPVVIGTPESKKIVQVSNIQKTTLISKQVISAVPGKMLLQEGKKNSVLTVFKDSVIKKL
jgi:hypothetical protein